MSLPRFIPPSETGKRSQYPAFPAIFGALVPGKRGRNKTNSFTFTCLPRGKQGRYIRPFIPSAVIERKQITASFLIAPSPFRESSQCPKFSAVRFFFDHSQCRRNNGLFFLIFFPCAVDWGNKCFLFLISAVERKHMMPAGIITPSESRDSSERPQLSSTLIAFCTSLVP